MLPILRFSLDLLRNSFVNSRMQHTSSSSGVPYCRLQLPPLHSLNLTAFSVYSNILIFYCYTNVIQNSTAAKLLEARMLE
jgi:hypothetical protein